MEAPEAVMAIAKKITGKIPEKITEKTTVRKAKIPERKGNIRMKKSRKANPLLAECPAAEKHRE